MMPVKRGAVRHARSATLGLGWLGRQQRGDEGPQLVADKRFAMPQVYHALTRF